MAVVVFVTNFLLLHLALLATGSMWLAKIQSLGWVGLAVCSVLLGAYVGPDLKRHGIFPGLAFAGIRYCADMALFAGAVSVTV